MASISALLENYLSNDQYWAWSVIAAILIAVEVILPTSWLLWPALAAVALAVISYVVPDIGWTTQIIGFVLLSFGFTWAGRKYVRTNPITSNSPHLNKRLDAMTGRRGTTLDDSDNEFNHIKLDDTVWQVKNENSTSLAKDTTVEVTGNHDGMLIVKPV